MTRIDYRPHPEIAKRLISQAEAENVSVSDVISIHVCRGLGLLPDDYPQGKSQRRKEGSRRKGRPRKDA